MAAHFEQGWILDREREMDSRAREMRISREKKKAEPGLLGLVANM